MEILRTNGKLKELETKMDNLFAKYEQLDGSSPRQDMYMPQMQQQ